MHVPDILVCWGKRRFSNMNKTILATMIISIFFAFTCTASATTSGSSVAQEPQNAVPTDTLSLTDDGIAPQSSSGVGLVFRRTSSSQAKAQAQANRAGASSVTSTIVLQKKSNGTYKKVSSASKTVKDNHINHIKYFSIASSGTYRIKVTISYKEDGVTRGNTYYKSMN